jgi:uncharacterized membrane protein
MWSTTNPSGGCMIWRCMNMLRLSLIPFAGRWMGENRFAAAPSARSGVVLFMTVSVHGFDLGLL